MACGSSESCWSQALARANWPKLGAELEKDKRIVTLLLMRIILPVRGHSTLEDGEVPITLPGRHAMLARGVCIHLLPRLPVLLVLQQELLRALAGLGRLLLLHAEANRAIFDRPKRASTLRD